MVSVSRFAGLPQAGQGTSRQVGCQSSGLPGRSKVTSSGSRTGRFSFFSGTTPQSAQWTTGIGQPQKRCAAEPPVAQAEPHLRRAQTPWPPSSRWWPRCPDPRSRGSARRNGRHSPPARISAAPAPRSRHRSGAPGRWKALTTGKPVFPGEIKVALVMRRAAEDGAGAIVHQHEIARSRPAAGGRERPDGARSARYRSPSSRRSPPPLPRCRCGGTRR